MAEQVKKKLCWNCEGSVSKSLETCPYCGVYLSPTLDGKEDDIIPPYKSESQQNKEHALNPPYQPDIEEVDEASGSALEKEGEKNDSLTVLMLLTSGFLFGLFGIIVYFFSTNGYLILSWPQNYGLGFIIASLPLLYLGIRGFNRY